MTKSQRSNAPVSQPAPWSPSIQPEFSNEGKAAIEESKPDAAEPFEPQPNVAIPKPPAGWEPEPQQQSPFDERVKTKSVFAPPIKAKVEVKEEVFPLGEDDPTWVELVKFCQKHCEVIIQAHYPHPRGACIDTIWRGITVIAHPTTQVRHVTHGWIDWKDAIY
jgi:hypothetical protein